MGLLDNTKNIELAITEKNKQEQQKQIEKRKKQQEAEDLQRLKSDIIRELKQYFDNAMEESKDLQRYYLKKYYIDFANSIFERYGNNKAKQANEILDIIDNNYYKILKNKITIQKKQFKIIEEYEQQQEQKEQEEENKKALKWCYIENIIKILFYILLAPLILIIMIIFGAIKNSK